MAGSCRRFCFVLFGSFYVCAARRRRVFQSWRVMAECRRSPDEPQAETRVNARRGTAIIDHREMLPDGVPCTIAYVRARVILLCKICPDSAEYPGHFSRSRCLLLLGKKRQTSLLLYAAESLATKRSCTLKAGAGWPVSSRLSGLGAR